MNGSRRRGADRCSRPALACTLLLLVPGVLAAGCGTRGLEPIETGDASRRGVYVVPFGVDGGFLELVSSEGLAVERDAYARRSGATAQVSGRMQAFASADDTPVAVLTLIDSGGSAEAGGQQGTSTVVAVLRKDRSLSLARVEKPTPTASSLVDLRVADDGSRVLMIETGVAYEGRESCAGQTRMRDLSGRLLWVFRPPGKELVLDASASNDLSVVAVTCNRPGETAHAVRVFRDGKHVGTIRSPDATKAQVRPDGAGVAVAWSTPGNATLEYWTGPDFSSRRWSVPAPGASVLEFSGAGDQLLSGSLTTEYREGGRGPAGREVSGSHYAVYDSRSGRVIWERRTPAGGMWMCALDPAGRRALLWMWAGDGQAAAELVDLRKRETPVRALSEAVSQARFTPAGTVIYVDPAGVVHADPVTD